ncbi:hypothetical protein QTP86_016192, partial [Hemibagrus guttatus]
MKILLLLILYLISGPVDSSDVNGYSGGSVTIISGIQWYIIWVDKNNKCLSWAEYHHTCNYPVEYERNTKYVIKVDDNTKIEPVLDTDTQFQNGRFSISDDRSAKVLTVNISDIRETDEAFYLFGVRNVQGTEHKHSPNNNRHLPDDLSRLIETPSAVCFCSSVIIISVCVCVTLLLIGGFTLIMIYKLKQKRIP